MRVLLLCAESDPEVRDSGRQGSVPSLGMDYPPRTWLAAFIALLRCSVLDDCAAAHGRSFSHVAQAHRYFCSVASWLVQLLTRSVPTHVMLQQSKMLANRPNHGPRLCV